MNAILYKSAVNIKKYVYSVVGLILFLGVIFDYQMPLGVAAGIVYVVPVALGFWFEKKSHVIFVAFIGSALTIIGYFISNSGSEGWIVLTNRGVSLLVIWVAALFVCWGHRIIRNLQQSEARMSLALEASHSGFWLRAVEDQDDYWSDENARLLGYMPGEVNACYENWAARIHPDDRVKAKEKFLNCVLEKKDIALEYRVLHPDGKILWVEMLGKHIFDKEAGDDIFTAIQIDITDRKLTEIALQENENLYHVLHDILPVGVVMRAANGTIISSNPAAHKILNRTEDQVSGYTSEEFPWKTFREDGSPFLVKDHPAEICLATGKPQNNIVMGWAYLGKTVWVRVNCVPLFKENALKPYAVLSSFNDITTRKNTEDLLIEAKRKAEAASKAKSDFLTSMSHELRTPLNAVLGYAQMLQYNPTTPLTETQNQHVESILTGGNHLLELVNEVLDLSSIEADHFSLDLQEIEASKIIDDCLALVNPLCEKLNITITNNFDAEAKFLLNTDEKRLKQALINIIGNAIKFNKQDGTILIENEITDGGYLRISVSDTGIGIIEDQKTNIFQMFHRLNIDPMTTNEGNGIGLHVTRLLIERMAGRVGFESEIGKGSTFWVDLPLISSEGAIIWTDSLKVGVDAIDQDHQKLIALTNKVSISSVDDQDLDHIISELIEYTRFHFKREEVIMEMCKYPDLIEHKEKHRKLIAKITELADAWYKDHDLNLYKELRKFLRSWWVGHIMNVDTEITIYTEGYEQAIKTALEDMK